VGRIYITIHQDKIDKGQEGIDLLHIVACIKQVPDTKVIKMNPKTNTMDRASAPAILNPYDAHAVEEAVSLKNKYGGTVSVVTMGPPPAVKAIRKCIEIGADEGYMISDRAFAGADTLATSYALTKAINKISEIKPIDLIICGKMTIDGDTGQVGPGIARRLDIPPLTSVNKVVEIQKDDAYMVVHRKLEDGYEVVQTTLPCLLSVEKEINEVPYSSFPNMLKAARYKPVIWSVNDLEDIDRKQLGLKGSPTIVAKVWAPPKPEGGKLLEGNSDEQVQQLLSVVLEKKELFAEMRGLK
jgi:electron transfer flavoprotein beta subunit